jgi:hypothetical protein
MRGPIVIAITSEPICILPKPTPAINPKVIPKIIANSSTPHLTNKKLLILKSFMRSKVSSSYTIEGYPVEIMKANPSGKIKIPDTKDIRYKGIVLIVI